MVTILNKNPAIERIEHFFLVNLSLDLTILFSTHNFSVSEYKLYMRQMYMYIFPSHIQFIF